MTATNTGIRIPRGLATKINAEPCVRDILEVLSNEEELHPQQGLSLKDILNLLPENDHLKAAHYYLFKSGIIVRKKGTKKDNVWIIKPTLAWSIKNYINQTGVYAA